MNIWANRRTNELAAKMHQDIKSQHQSLTVSNTKHNQIRPQTPYQQSAQKINTKFYQFVLISIMIMCIAILISLIVVMNSNNNYSYDLYVIYHKWAKIQIKISYCIHKYNYYFLRQCIFQVLTLSSYGCEWINNECMS